MPDLRYHAGTFACLGLEPRRTRASVDAVHAWEAKHNITLPPAAMSDPQDAVRIQAIAALEKLGESARPGEATLRAATTDSSEYVKRISTRALIKLDLTKK